MTPATSESTRQIPFKPDDGSMSMQKTITMSVFILLALGIAASHAENMSSPKSPRSQSDIEEQYTKKIYTWIDSNGVQHFSNKRPPEGVRNIKLINPAQSPSPHGTGQLEIKKKQAYDRMVEKSKSKAIQLEKERKSKGAAAAAERQRRADKIRNDRIAAERKRLQDEIAAINARGLSPTFSKGMKTILIRKVQEKLEKLKKDPDTYFQSE
jgi:hypothetical protein